MDSSRRDTILKLIVEDFIDTAEPVGSKTLIERHGLTWSSATIRNDMMILEEDGLIEKQHHSSGRIPSSLGYKYYLEKLKGSKESYEIDEDFKREFSLILDRRAKTVEDVMEQSCQILSEMTDLATLVLGPEANLDRLASIQVIPIDDNALTAIIVTDKGYVENKTFVISEELVSGDIQAAVQLINKRLVGSSINELGEKLDAMRPLITELLGEKTNMLIEAFSEAFISFAKKRVETYGTRKLLGIPEYEADRQKLSNIIKLLEDPEGIDKVLSEESSDETYQLVNDDDNDLTIVARGLSINGQDKGKIAVVGPKRMNYRKVLASLEYVARSLNSLYKEVEKEEEDG